MDYVHNPEKQSHKCTLFQMYTIPDRHRQEWTQSRSTIPNKHDLKCTRYQTDIIPNGDIPD